MALPSSLGTTIGKYDSIETAVEQLVMPRDVYYPRQKFAQQYDEKLKAYEQIYPALRTLNYQV